MVEITTETALICKTLIEAELIKNASFGKQNKQLLKAFKEFPEDYNTLAKIEKLERIKRLLKKMRG